MIEIILKSLLYRSHENYHLRFLPVSNSLFAENNSLECLFSVSGKKILFQGIQFKLQLDLDEGQLKKTSQMNFYNITVFIVVS
jgi:hypothetical protein